jgi:hypothetical protein
MNALEKPATLTRGMSQTRELELRLEERRRDLPASADAVYEVKIRDPEFAGIEVSFEYWMVSGFLLLDRVQIESVGPGDAGVTEITPTFLRAEARWGVWEAAARIRVEESVEDTGEELHPAEGASPLEILRPGSGRVDWAKRLAVLALEYRSVVKGGVRNPVEVIAGRTGTPIETIRAWVHRARNEGYLQPWKARPGAAVMGRCWLCEGSGMMRCPRRDRLEKEVSGDPQSSAESVVLALFDHYCDDEDFAAEVNGQATSSSRAHKRGWDADLMACPRCGESGLGPQGPCVRGSDTRSFEDLPSSSGILRVLVDRYLDDEGLRTRIDERVAGS